VPRVEGVDMDDGRSPRAYREVVRGWLEPFGVLLGVYLVGWVVLAALRDDLCEWRSYRAVARLVRRIGRRHHIDAAVLPMSRPIEQVGADLRRLHAAFHRGGMRFAKYEGCRQAYDRVLGEAAEMAGITHLLGLLPPGHELDRERERVEALLEHHGLLPPPYAA
jgi:hypothetical protein